MANYIVVRNSDYVIVNHVVLDDPAQWDPPEGHSAFAAMEPMKVGGTYANGVYTAPYEPPPFVPPTLPDANARLDAGIAAVENVLNDVKEAIHAIAPTGAVPQRFDALLLQLKILSDVIATMLQAQKINTP